MRIFTVFKILIISSLLSLSVKAQTLCTPKTDYDPDIKCSGVEFYADSMEDVITYGQDYGLEDGKYKPLRIRFPLTGERAEVRSPCKITFKNRITHTAANVCIDGQKGVVIGGNSIFKATGTVTVLSTKGSIEARNSTVLQAQNLEMTSFGQLILAKGARAEIGANMKLDSSFEDERIVSARIARGTLIRAGSFELTAEGKINIAKNASITATESDITIESRGTGIPERVTLFREAALTAAGNIAIQGGNLLAVMGGVKIEADGKLTLDAKGCRMGNATLKGVVRSGTCLATGSLFNRHPTALMDITPDTGEAPLTVTLDASRSRDRDGTLTGYTWTFSDGTTLSGIRVTKTFPKAGVKGIALTVTDDDGSQAQKRGIVTVMRPAGSPTANFTYHPTGGDTPLTVTFDGSGSTDPDGSIVKYEWIFDDGTILEGINRQRTFDTEGTYTVSLRVTDDDGLTHQTGESAITVIESNAPPVMVGDQNFQGMQNKSLSFTLNGATDEDGDPLTYALVNSPASGTLSGCLEGANDLSCTFTPASDFIGEIIFSYKANDGKLDSETVSVVTLSLMPYNDLPISDAGADQTAVFGDLVGLDGSASHDPEGETLAYSWDIVSRPMLSDVMLANPNTAKPEFVADREGIYTFRLSVSDGKLSASEEVTVTVVGETNVAPTLKTITSPQSVQVGQELRFVIEGSDADSHDKLVYSAINLPEGARFIGARPGVALSTGTASDRES